MKHLSILLGLLILLSFTAADQKNPEGILITIKKGHKKITYVAENVTETDISIFFKVESSGFRRSADRPLITLIPAKSKRDLLTLIPLTGKDTTHSYIAIKTQPENNLQFTKTDSLEKDIRKVRPVKKN